MAALLLMFILIMAFTLLQSMKTYEDKLQQQQQSQIELQEQQEVLNAKQQQLEDANQQLESQQQQLDRLIGVKAEIIEALQKQFEHSDLTVQVDPQTGAITFDSNILFAVNESKLSTDGTDFLNRFLPMYLSVLLSDEFSNYISEIIIEGHTDTDGSYMYNLNLSQERAYAVAAYCLDDKSAILSEKEQKQLRSIATANGRSFSDPILTKNGKVDKDASRRVVFKFRLKDDEMIAEIQHILDGVQDD